MSELSQQLQTPDFVIRFPEDRKTLEEVRLRETSDLLNSDVFHWLDIEMMLNYKPTIELNIGSKRYSEKAKDWHDLLD